MRPVRLERDAENDVAEILDWYEQQRAGLGQEFLDQLSTTFRDIAETPKSFPYIHSMTRRALMRRFPYLVLFREYHDEIVVLGVIHGSRDPSKPKRRSW